MASFIDNLKKKKKRHTTAVRMDQELWAELQKLSKKMKISVNTIMVKAIESALSK